MQSKILFQLLYSVVILSCRTECKVHFGTYVIKLMLFVISRKRGFLGYWKMCSKKMDLLRVLAFNTEICLSNALSLESDAVLYSAVSALVFGSSWSGFIVPTFQWRHYGITCVNRPRKLCIQSKQLFDHSDVIVCSVHNGV